MDPFASPHDRPAPPTYDEEPPSYAFPNESSVLDAGGDNATTSTPPVVRNNAASMRLLPSGGGNLGSVRDDASNFGSAGRFRMSQNMPSRQQYVALGDDPPPPSTIRSPISAPGKGVPRAAMSTITEETCNRAQAKGALLPSSIIPIVHYDPMASSGEVVGPPAIPSPGKTQLHVTWEDESANQESDLTQSKLEKTKVLNLKKSRLSDMVPGPLRLASPKPPVHILPHARIASLSQLHCHP
ncbi:hypothetical protein ACJ72_08459 [Emergomyces africanus]|uniref:Uncharacterized protein n=1 Tax=Emergomyces africanus TaxID=1955775 RepID=A0A1B7NKD7_9EURO|nr:hypothetical protein ACJ72_08459 [Emergomyces africanus]